MNRHGCPTRTANGAFERAVARSLDSHVTMAGSPQEAPENRSPLGVELKLRGPLDAEAYATRIDREPGFTVLPAGSTATAQVRLTDRCSDAAAPAVSGPPTIRLIDLPPFIGPGCDCCVRYSRGGSWPDLFRLIEKTAGCTGPVRPPDELSGLTRRERDVLRLVGEGKTVAESAAILGLAESTVGNHKHRLMRKLGVKTSLALLRIAVRNGLAPLE